LCGVVVLATPSDASAEKFAIILQAGSKGHDGMARAVHALLYAKELKEQGHDVVLIFDGAGTEWAEQLSDPAGESGLAPLYTELKLLGIIEVVCDHCAQAFRVKDQLAQRNAPLTAEYAGHPSVAKWVAKGYQLVVL
jgi:hypothetical protein